MKTLVDLYAEKAALELDPHELALLAKAVASCQATLTQVKKPAKVVLLLGGLESTNLDDYVRSLPSGVVAVNMSGEAVPKNN